MPANTDLIVEAGRLGGRNTDRLRQLYGDYQASSLNNLQLREAEAAMAANERMQELAPTFINDDGTPNYGAVMRAQGGAGDIKGMLETSTSQSLQGKNRAAEDLSKLKTASEQMKVVSSTLGAMAMSSPEEFAQAWDGLKEQGIPVERMVSREKPDPKTFGRLQEQGMTTYQQAQKAMDLLKMEIEKGEFERELGQAEEIARMKESGAMSRSAASNAARIQAANISSAARIRAAGMAQSQPSIQALSQEEREILNVGPDAPLYKTRTGEVKGTPAAEQAYKVEDQIQGIDGAIQSLDSLASDIDKEGALAGGATGALFGSAEKLGRREGLHTQALFNVGLPLVKSALQEHEQRKVEKLIQSAISGDDTEAKHSTVLGLPTGAALNEIQTLVGGRERALSALAEAKKTLLSEKSRIQKKAQTLGSSGSTTVGSTTVEFLD